MNNGLCISAALCYDLDGYRLGYGRDITTVFVGLPFRRYRPALQRLCNSKAAREEHDRRVGLIVTQDYTVINPSIKVRKSMEMYVEDFDKLIRI